MKHAFAWLGAALLAAACSPEAPTEQRTAIEHGRDLFASRATTEASSNVFSCATCHRAGPDPADTRILPGADLGGVTQRPTFWGGAYVDLLRAMNDCRTFFMAARRPWTPEDEDARAMWAWLESLPPSAPGAQPFTLPPVASDLPAGDKGRGAVVYDRACASCHGAPHTAENRLTSRAPKLPEESVAYFGSLGFDRTAIRTTFVEKVRHGPFLGLYGIMPPLSREALSDADLGALLAFLELY